MAKATKARPAKTAKAKSRKPLNKAPAQGVSAPAQVKKPHGGQTRYTPEAAEEILTRLAGGETLPKICNDPHLPARTTIINWVVDDREGFADRYARAREMQREFWADEMVDIADASSNDFEEREDRDGNVKQVPVKELVERARLRIDTRKWLMKVGSPHKYGDKIEQKHTGDSAFTVMWQSMGGGASKPQGDA